MASVKKNSAFYQQDAVMGKLSSEARRPREVNAIVRAAMEQGEADRIYRAKREAEAKLNPPRIYFRVTK
jgi:hypothetical protein